MLIEPIESLEKHTVGWGPARTAAEENMWGPGLPVQDCYCDETRQHVNTDTHLAREMTFFSCETLTLGCVVASRFFVLLSPPPPLSRRVGWALTSTHESTLSVWHRALWWDAPWPALIHRGESKWRGSEIDRSKDSLSELKANRH